MAYGLAIRTMDGLISLTELLAIRRVASFQVTFSARTIIGSRPLDLSDHADFFTGRGLHLVTTGSWISGTYSTVGFVLMVEPSEFRITALAPPSGIVIDYRADRAPNGAGSWTTPFTFQADVYLMEEST